MMGIDRAHAAGPGPPDADELLLAELLAAYESGNVTDGEYTRADTPAARETLDLTHPLQHRLDRAIACVRLLERLARDDRACGHHAPRDALERGDESPLPTRSYDRTAESGDESPHSKELDTALYDAGAPCAKGDDGVCRIGRFELIRELGRGGFGIVYLAFDPALRREVALKVPRPEVLLSATLRQRFAREARAAAALDHPNIVPVFETGEAGLICYIASAYCDGPTLARWLRERNEPVPTRTAATWIAALARAADHAHQRGVLHRDLKPSNVLLKGEARRLSDQSMRGSSSSTLNPQRSILNPVITDFGLAKLYEPDGDDTKSGAVMGTARYMAPEQAEGRGRDVGPHTDVYALGGILYEMICGRPAFSGDTELDTLRRVSSLEPEPARHLRPDVPRDLETICSKCLRKDTRDRYHDAAALADDLQCFLDGRPIQARPIGRLEIAARWVKRRPAAASLIVLVILAAPAFLLAKSLVTRRVERTRATELMAALLAADMASVPHIVQQLRPVRPLVEPELRRVVTGRTPESPDRLRAALALLPDDEQEEYLSDRVLSATPAEIEVITAALVHCQWKLADAAAGVLADGQANAARRLRAACVAARVALESQSWQELSSEIVDWLLAEDGHVVADLTRLLMPVRDHLFAPLQIQFQNGSRPASMRQAAKVLAELHADEPAALVTLLLDADPGQFEPLFVKLEPRRSEAVALLRAELETQADPQSGEGERIDIASRHARAATACFRFGERTFALDLLHAAADPRHRTETMELLGTLGAEPADITDAATAARDDFVRSGLVLALGNSDRADRIEPARAAVVRLLAYLYEHDPDPGVHAAAEWSLRRLKHDLAPLGGPASLDQAAAHEMRWATAPSGQVLVLFRDPEEFEMGDSTPVTGLAALSDGMRRQLAPPVRIRPAPFAIAMKETTVEQFRAFRPDHPNDHATAPDSSCPVTQVSFCEAAEYCNWLSQQDGLPADQWCFLPSASGQVDELTLAENFPSRAGYRLPTEAEWEYACRSGTCTSRFFGEADTKLADYGWFVNNSDKRAWPVGMLRPNAFGLFDVYGNVAEWCINSRGDGTAEQQCLRGDSFVYPAWLIASARRERAHAAGFRTNNVGFRIARGIAGNN